MPAMLDDPTAPTIYRTSGQGPYPTPNNTQIPSSIFPRAVTLRDRTTIATLIPFFTPNDVPERLLRLLCDNLNSEIENGDTYPMINPLPLETFGPYWFANFGAVMILGDIGGIEAVNDMDAEGADWNKLCLGSFYIKPNYPGRSSHVCNGGFIVTLAARNKGVGKSMGQCYLDWAPQLGYTYSVFNLVYESNSASTKIWDSLGFKRIGRVPGCGNLKSFSEPVDAIIYGRDLKAEGEAIGNEERFDKIRYYLRHSSYPQGADRSEKSRLRSAATHYKLLGGHDGSPERLMLKEKEVISDPQTQEEIAKQVHEQAHGGINKVTAVIATKYHWVRIKETVNHVIKNCPECKDPSKVSILRSDSTRQSRHQSQDEGIPHHPKQEVLTPPLNGIASTHDQQTQSLDDLTSELTSHHDDLTPQHDDMSTHPDLDPSHIDPRDFDMNHHVSLAQDHTLSTHDDLAYDDEMAIDPQIMEQLQAQLASETYPHDQHHHHSLFPQTGLPQYVDASQLQHHRDTHDYSVTTDPHQFTTDGQTHQFSNDNANQFVHDPATAMMAQHPSHHQSHHDQMMGDDDDGQNGSGVGGLNNMQGMQRGLLLDYINSDGTFHKQ